MADDVVAVDIVVELLCKPLKIKPFPVQRQHPGVPVEVHGLLQVPELGLLVLQKEIDLEDGADIQIEQGLVFNIHLARIL